MGKKVWAHRVGNFVQDSSTGWSNTIRFKGLGDLVSTLEDKNLKRQIDTLAIVAHGDSGGQIQLDRNLTPETLGSFAAEIAALNPFFEGYGSKLIFLSCIAAIGPSGDQLLIALSRMLSNVHIIGFTVNGVLPQEGLPSTPGSVLDGDGTIAGGVTAKMMRGMPVLTEYSAFSKWALNGFITKIPIQEQIKRPNFRCAWSLCPGHSSARHRCVPGIKGVGHPRPYPG